MVFDHIKKLLAFLIRKFFGIVNHRIFVILRKDDRSGISIPASAVLTAEDGRQVYVVDRDSRVNIRNVKTGEYVSDCVMIEEGLQEGDLVIVKGSQKVSKGMEVKTVEWKGKNQ